jgi:hypothetical protein
MKRPTKSPLMQTDLGCTFWHEDRCREGFQLALLGHTDKEIARVMGIDINTLDLWKRTHPEFKKALTEGKDPADARVAASLYKRACGFWEEWDEEEIFRGEIITLHKRRYFPPDSWAAARWLALRQRANWTESQKADASQQTNINIMNIDLSGMKFEELALLEKLGLKQLGQNAGTSN